MGLQVGRPSDHVGRADQPSDAPPGHGVGLGHPVEDHALLGELGHDRQDAVVLGVAVDEVLVDLVGDHDDAVLQRPAADRLDLLARVDGTGRVGRRDEHEQLGARRPHRLELFDGDPEAGRLVGRKHHRDAARHRDRLGVGGPERRRQEHLVTLVQQHGERRVDRVLATVGDHDLLRRDLTPESRMVFCAIAARSSGSPAAGVYRWFFGSRQAAAAASTM
jgi:hypothetical protein